MKPISYCLIERHSELEHSYLYVELFSGASTITDEQIETRTSCTVVAAVNTTADGSYSVTLNLKAVNNSATPYQIETTFYGDNALNLTGLATLPNGTSYAVCTTLHYYGYKPSANATMLTVEPQTTKTTQPKKTPEQMQQEAESGGGLTIWHEFSWWYPWYRMHVNIHVNPTWDVGFSPLLPDEGTGSGIDDIWDFFEGIFEEFVFDFVMGLVKIAGARILTYLAERASWASPWIQGIIMVAGCLTSIYLLSFDWNNKAALYGGALGAILVMVVTGGWKFAPIFAELLMYLIKNPSLQSIRNILSSIVQALTAMIAALFRTLIDLAEMLFGAALVIAALSRAKTL